MFNWIKKSDSRFAEKFKLDNAIGRVDSFLESYGHILKPLLGAEEFSRRLVYRLIEELKQEGIELKKNSLENIYSQIDRVLNEHDFFLEMDLNTLSANNIAEATEDCIYKLENLVEDEMKYPPESRILSKTEMKKLIKMLFRCLKYFEKAAKYEIEDATEAYEKSSKWEQRLQDWLVKRSERKRTGKQVDNFLEDAQKTLKQIVEIIESRY